MLGRMELGLKQLKKTNLRIQRFVQVLKFATSVGVNVLQSYIPGIYPEFQKSGKWRIILKV